MTLQVGITGGIGAGKTTVCRIFEALGVPVYYADERARHILMRNHELHQELRDHFGEEIFDREGKPDRKKIAAIVFNDKEKLQTLNGLIHPRVGTDWADWADWVSSRDYAFPYVLKEAALLFESGSYKQLDRIICVAAPDDLRISRVVSRDGVSGEDVKLRMKNQLSQELKISLSQFLILNDEKESLIQQVIRVHRKILKLAEQKK